MAHRPRPLPGALLMLLLLSLAACSTASPAGTTASAVASPTDTPSSTPGAPSASATPLPTASSTPGAGGPVIVTFRVGETEQYRILLTDPAEVANAEALLAGDPDAHRIPNGLVVRDGDGGVNTGWSWHIDPADVDFADMTIEVCDGLPSDVERGAISGDRFCPWSAEVVSIEPAG